MSRTLAKSTRRGPTAYSARFLASVLVVSAAVAPAVRGESISYFLDAIRGVDDDQRDGTSSFPFRTIAYAVERAGAAGATGLDLVLSPGTFEAPSAETIAVPPAFERFALVGSAEGTSIEGGACGPFLSWVPGADGGLATLALTDLTILGGRSAVDVLAESGHALLVALRRVRFLHQGEMCLFVSVEDAATVRLEVLASEFESPAGLVLETLPGADASLTVEDSSFSSSPDLPVATASGVPSVGAIALHAANGSRLEARLDRNRFRDVPVAVTVSADQTLHVSGASLSVLVQNSVVDGFAVERPYGIRHAFLLSLWPHHAIDVRFCQNTIVGVEGAVVAQDNLDILGAGAAIPWTFANNVCSAIESATEFAAEYDPATDSFVPGFPPQGVVVRNNVLERSPLALSGVDGNVHATNPGFVSAAEHDFRLTPTSPAVDAGAIDVADGLEADVDGNCRVATAVCDGATYRVDAGAFEHPGFCRGSVRFLRGDCGFDGGLQLSDPITLFNFLFLGAATPACPDACDADDDGSTTLTDGIMVLTYLFLGGPEPRSPGVRPGYDPTCDTLSCSGSE